MKSFLVLAFLFAATAASGQSSATTSSCTDGKWSTPVPLLTQDGRPAYVEPGSAAQFGDHMLMVGSPTLIWSSPDTFFPIDSVKVLRDSAQLGVNFTRSGLLVGRDGVVKALPRIPTQLQWSFPSLVRTAAQQFTVVWGVDTLKHDAFAAQQMWSATFDGTNWGSPEMVSVPLGPDDGTFSLPDNRVSSPVFARARVADGKQNLIVGVQTTKGWSTLSIPASGLINSTNSVPVSDGAVILVIGGQTGPNISVRRITTNSARALTAEDSQTLDSVDARTWTGMEAALVRLGKDSLLAVWTYAKGPEKTTTTPLYSAISPDGGRTWKPRTSLDVSGYPNSLRAVRDQNGIVHLVFEAPDEDVLGIAGVVRHVSFANGRWGSVETASNRPTATRLILGATDTGIMISWGESVAYLGGQVPRSYAAWWDSSCKH